MYGAGAGLSHAGELFGQLVGDGREQVTITGQQWSSVERVDDMWVQSWLSRSATMSRISSTRSSTVIDLGSVRTRPPGPS